MTNRIKFTKKNKIKETPAVSGLTMLVEDELEKAQVILAVEDILETLQDIAENLAKIAPNAILPALDFMRNSFGPEATDNFYKSTTSALGDATTAIQRSREIVNTQLDRLQSGDMSPSNDMASDDGDINAPSGDELGMDSGESDIDLGDMTPEPEKGEDAFDLGDDSMNTAGRARKESIRYNVRALQETSNPDGMILNAYRKAFRESHQATRAVRVVSESFAIDLADVIEIVQEAAKAVEEGRSRSDYKDREDGNDKSARNREEVERARREKQARREKFGEARAESPTLNTRLISKHEGRDGCTAEVRRDKDNGEYQTHFYLNGKHMGEGPISYHGSDSEGKKDATDTAIYELNHYKFENNGKRIRDKEHTVEESNTRRRGEDGEDESKKVDRSKLRREKENGRKQFDEATTSKKKPDADKDGIPNWADKNPFKAGGPEDRKPSKKS